MMGWLKGKRLRCFLKGWQLTSTVCSQCDEERRWRVACDAWVGVDEVEHYSLCLSPLSFLLFLLLPHLTFPPFHCQVACPGQMIFGVHLNLTQQWRLRKENGTSLNLLWAIELQQQCLCACLKCPTLRDTSKSEEQNAACAFRSYLIFSCGGHFVMSSTGLLCFFHNQCVARAFAIKLLVSVIHLKTRGLPVGCFYLHLHSHPQSQSMWLLIGSRVPPPFVKVCMWTSSLWGLSKKPFKENNDPCRLAF